MSLQELIMEQANAINNISASAYKEGYKKGFEDGSRKTKNFFDNADKAYEAEKDREAVEEMGDIIESKELTEDNLIKEEN